MSHSDVAGVVLAGGQARRMNNRDKGLIELAGQPLAHRAARRLAPQTDCVFINANRHIDDYRRFGHPVLEDKIQGYPGPLAGFHAGMTAAAQKYPYILFVPCDSPFFPLDLADRLYAPLVAAEAEIAVVSANQRPQPVFLLARTALADSLADFIREEQKIMRWCRRHRLVEVEFSDAACFDNINTPEDLAAAASRLDN